MTDGLNRSRHFKHQLLMSYVTTSVVSGFWLAVEDPSHITEVGFCVLINTVWGRKKTGIPFCRSNALYMFHYGVRVSRFVFSCICMHESSALKKGSLMCECITGTCPGWITCLRAECLSIAFFKAHSIIGQIHCSPRVNQPYILAYDSLTKIMGLL